MLPVNVFALMYIPPVMHLLPLTLPGRHGLSLIGHNILTLYFIPFSMLALNKMFHSCQWEPRQGGIHPSLNHILTKNRVPGPNHIHTVMESSRFVTQPACMPKA